MTGCDHRYTAIRFDFRARSATVRCSECGHERTLECEFVMNERDEVVALASPLGWGGHVSTDIKLEV